MKSWIKKIIFIFLLLFAFTTTKVSVNAVNITNIDQINYNDYTDDEKFVFENDIYKLENYIDSIIGVDNLDPEIALYARNTYFTVDEENVTTMNVAGDDPIISLIPKDLFRTPDISKVHIGKEYGFFIKTKNIDGIIYSNVYLFDLANDFQESDVSHYKFTIKPLFQREFVYFDEPVTSIKTQLMIKNRTQGNGRYENYLLTNIVASDVVAPLPYITTLDTYNFTENKEFYMSDVKNVVNIANEQYLNYGQEGYNPYEDKGMFITQQDIEYQVKVYNVNDDAFMEAADVVINTGVGHLVDAIIGEIPGASAVKEIIAAAINISNATSDEINNLENKLTYVPKHVTADAQIKEYGYLAKSSVSSLGIDLTKGNYGEGSYLFLNNYDYISFDYQLSYTPVENEGGYELPWETRIIRGLSLTFNSYSGNDSIQESDIYNFILNDDNDREYKDLLKDNIVSILPDGDNLFTFTPDKSGHYTLATSNSMYIPKIEIIDSNLSVNPTSINQTDVSINVYLQKGVTYKFRITYLEADKYGSFSLKYDFIPQEIYLGDNLIELLHDEYYYKFIPEDNAYYTITDDNNEPLIIFDKDLHVQSTNVDGCSLLNKEEVYYIILNNSDYNTTNINININKQIEVLFYNNRSDAEAIKTLYFSSNLQEELYVSSQYGYEFIGWETYDGIFVENVDSFAQPTLKLYAKWRIVIYTINYYGIDGEIIQKDIYTVETGLDLDKSPIIPEYIILSWVDENGNLLTDSSNILSDINCYPNYAKVKSTITFDLNSDITDGIRATLSSNIDSIEIYYDQQINLPIPMISGFEFIGWYNNDTQVSDYSGQMFPGVNFIDDTVVVAKWVRTEYHFSIEMINSNDVYSFSITSRTNSNTDNFILPVGVVVNNTFAVSYLEELLNKLLEDALINDNLTIDNYKPGYHFEYYTSTLNDSNTRVYMIDLNNSAEGFIFYPYYESNEYRFNLFDNNLVQIVEVNYESYLEKYLNNEPVLTPKFEIFKEGYLYQGVYRVAGNEIIDSENKLTPDGLVFLQSLVNLSYFDLAITYSPINYHVEYNYNGGSGIMRDSHHVYDEYSRLEKNTFSKTGYTFMGWNTSPNGTGTGFDDYENVISLSNLNDGIVVLYAQWEANTYYVKYNTNGGTGNSYSNIYLYDKNLVISNNQFSRTGYSFLGWSKSSNGSVEYLPGDSVKNIISQNHGTINLYAIWKANTYTITYKNLLKSMYTPTLTSYTFGETTKLHTFIDYSNGYAITEFEKFYGWYEDANFTKPITQISASHTGNIDLYAKYDYTQYIYSNMVNWTITDSGNVKKIICDKQYFNRYFSEINGAFDKVKIELTLIMKEIDDGYQEIKLYCYLDDKTKSVIIDESAFEYGGNSKNSNFNKVTFAEEFNISVLNNFNELYLEFGAHGFGNDDWEISYVYVTLNYSQN